NRRTLDPLSTRRSSAWERETVKQQFGERCPVVDNRFSESIGSKPFLHRSGRRGTPRQPCFTRLLRASDGSRFSERGTRAAGCGSDASTRGNNRVTDMTTLLQIARRVLCTSLFVCACSSSGETTQSGREAVAAAAAPPVAVDAGPPCVEWCADDRLCVCCTGGTANDRRPPTVW